MHCNGRTTADPGRLGNGDSVMSAASESPNVGGLGRGIDIRRSQKLKEPSIGATAFVLLKLLGRPCVDNNTPISADGQRSRLSGGFRWLRERWELPHILEVSKCEGNLRPDCHSRWKVASPPLTAALVPSLPKRRDGQMASLLATETFWGLGL